jgi:predicted ester cyclase
VYAWLTASCPSTKIVGEWFGMAATGKQMSIRGVSVLEIKDSKLWRCMDYYTMALLMKQLDA